MNNTQISANWRVTNSRIFANLVNFMKFPAFSLMFWSIFKFNKFFPDFSGQYSNSLTFPVFPVSMPALIHGFTIMEYWAYYGSNPSILEKRPNWKWIAQSLFRFQQPYVRGWSVKLWTPFLRYRNIFSYLYLF